MFSLEDGKEVISFTEFIEVCVYGSIAPLSIEYMHIEF
jgi:hypothetical protein